MRLISLIVALLIIGFLVNKQLAPDSSTDDINTYIENQDPALPKLPVAPKDIKGFENDMNKFMQDTATERKEELQELEEKLNQ